MVMTIFGVVVGAIIAVIITIFIENLRKPKLELKIAPPVDRKYQDRPANSVRFLGLYLVNKPLPFFAKWMSRNAALQCHGTITFHHLNDGQNFFGRAMTIRWSGSPEPISLQFGIDGKLYSIVDQSKVTLVSKIDIYPDEKGRLAGCGKPNAIKRCFLF